MGFINQLHNRAAKKSLVSNDFPIKIAIWGIPVYPSLRQTHLSEMDRNGFDWIKDRIETTRNTVERATNPRLTPRLTFQVVYLVVHYRNRKWVR